MADLPKPVAQVQRMGSYQGVPAYGCLLTIEAEKRLKVNDPLFSLAELDAYAAAQVAEERERLCAAIKAADDKAVEEADYMLTSDDCISLIRGTWAGFQHVAAIRSTEAQNHPMIGAQRPVDPPLGGSGRKE